MAPVTRQGTAITEFGGLNTNVGPVVSGQGAMSSAVQINLTNVRSGELATRPGLKKVVFDEDEA